MSTPVHCRDCGQIVVHNDTAKESLQKLAFANHASFCRPGTRIVCDICREVQILHDAGETDLAVYLRHLPSLRTYDGLHRHLVDHGSPLAAVKLGLHTRPPAPRPTPPITHIRKDPPPMNTLQAVPKDTARPPAATLASHDDKRIARAAQKVLDAEAALGAAWEQHAAKAALRAKRDRLRKQLAEVEAQIKGGAPAAVDPKQVRAWAAANGHDVAPSGMIPKAIVADYLDATGGGAA